jgi:hypothetical protein
MKQVVQVFPLGSLKSALSDLLQGWEFRSGIRGLRRTAIPALISEGIIISDLNGMVARGIGEL